MRTPLRPPASYGNTPHDAVLELAMKIDDTVKRTDPMVAGRAGPRAGHQSGAVWHLAGRGRGGADLPDHQAAEGILMVTQINLGDIAVDVVFKDIKNVHLSVYPPTGQVRISAPLRMDLDTIRVFAISKLGWIKQQQQEAARTGARDAARISGPRKPLRLGKALPAHGCREGPVTVRRTEAQPDASAGAPGTDADKRQAIVEDWYREQLKEAVPPLIAKWEPMHGREGEAVFCAADEDQMGELQPEHDRSASTRIWPRSPRNVWNTSWCMKWSTCWNRPTTPVSLRSWTDLCPSGVLSGQLNRLPVGMNIGITESLARANSWARNDSDLNRWNKWDFFTEISSNPPHTLAFFSLDRAALRSRGNL